MIPAIFDQWSQSSKKVLFLYNMLTGHFDYLSPAFDLIWEIDPATVLQTPEHLLTGIEEQDREAVAARLEKVTSGLACEIEFGLQFPDNRLKQVKVDAHPILDASGSMTHVMGQAEDVTQQWQYREYLLEFSHKKDNVLQIVAHDLQGPLAIMKGITELLDLDHAQHNYKDLSRYTDIITRAYSECTQLINEVLLDEHTASISTPVKRVRFNAIGKARQMTDAFVRSKVIKSTIHVRSQEESIMVELDEVKFTQILNNLITNSVKFTPPEGSITITLAQDGANLLLTHADTGIGIPKDLQPYLFEKNSSKATRRGLNGEESNGIGLSIIKDLVELQGGKIKLESEESKGATFYLSFPLL